MDELHALADLITWLLAGVLLCMGVPAAFGLARIIRRGWQRSPNA